MRTVLRQRNFALLWVGGMISNLGDWLLLIALPFYVYQRTGSALATGTMFVAETIPSILLGSVAGVFVDRWDRRRTMIVCTVAQAGLTLMLLTVRSPEKFWIIYLVGFLQSAIGQFFNPASSALLPRVVGEQHMLAANSLGALTGNITRLVGPSLGGALLALAGLPSVVLADATSFVFSAVMIALIHISPAPPDERVAPDRSPAGMLWVTLGSEWREGLRLVWHDHRLTIIFLLMGSFMAGQGIVNVLLVLFVKNILHGGALEYGLLPTAQALGGILGALLMAGAGRRAEPARLITVGLWGSTLLFLVIVNVPILALDLALIAALGVPVLGVFVSVQTLLQSSVGELFRGRVFGTYGTVTSLCLLLGMGLAGTLGDRLGVVPMLNMAGFFFIMAGGLALLLPRVRSEAELCT